MNTLAICTCSVRIAGATASFNSAMNFIDTKDDNCFFEKCRKTHYKELQQFVWGGKTRKNDHAGDACMPRPFNTCDAGFFYLPVLGACQET
jgi:hypothetical protein